MKWRLSPLRARLAAAVLLVQVLLVAVLAVNMLQSWEHVARDNLSRRVQEMNLLFNSTLTPMLMARDYATAGDQMESIRSGNQIDYLVLFDRRGKVGGRQRLESRGAIAGCRFDPAVRPHESDLPRSD
jgi:hypothetical protein